MTQFYPEKNMQIPDLTEAKQNSNVPRPALTLKCQKKFCSIITKFQ